MTDDDPNADPEPPPTDASPVPPVGSATRIPDAAVDACARLLWDAERETQAGGGPDPDPDPAAGSGRVPTGP